MKNQSSVVLFLAMGMVMFFSKAEDKGIEGGMKIRFMGGQRGLSMLAEAEKIQKEIVTQRQDWEKKIKNIEMQLKAKATALEQKAKTANQAALEKDREEIEKLQRDGKNMAQEAETKLRREFDKSLGMLNQKMKVAIDKIREQKGYDLVLLEEGGIISGNPKYDITQEVVDYMNVEFNKTKPTVSPAVKK